MNEAETRAEHIDPALRAAGWGVVEGSKILREYPITPGRIEGHGRRGKPLIADYVLVYRNRKLGVVEAKALDEELTEGVAQAKNYAGKLAVRYAYSTNGQGIYQVDIRRTSLTSSSLMSATAAAPTTRATGALSLNTSPPSCSSASPPRPSAKTTWTPMPIDRKSTRLNSSHANIS